MIKISVVILTYNSVNFIKPCLDSVFTQGSQDLEVIVVDNGSKDATVSLIKENYPQVILIKNKDNLGACRGRNQGIEVSGGEWVLTLDCDIILQENFLASILPILDSLSPKTGILQPKIMNYTGDEIYSAGIYKSFLNRFFDVGRGLPDSGLFDNMRNIFGGCCAASLYRRKIFDEISDKYGYFDERFFFIFEDVDLSWRAQRKGWSTLYYPKAKCFHCGNSSNTIKKNRQYLSFRNRNLLIAKNENLVAIIFKLSFYLIYDLPRLLVILFNYKGRLPSLKKALCVSKC